MDQTLNRLLRHGIGFDQIDRFFDTRQPNFPHYNIAQVNPDHYRVTLAVAGFTRDEITILEQNSSLVVKGAKLGAEDSVEYIHRGIALRDFEREWKLGDHVEVKEAKLENGLLIIDLVREIPEEAKPKMISIS